MKKLTWLVTAILGVGSFIATLDARAAVKSFENTNVLAAANETKADVWVIDDLSKKDNIIDLIIVDSTITAEPGKDVEYVPDVENPPDAPFALGTTAIKSIGFAHGLTINDSHVLGSRGGTIYSDPAEQALGKLFTANGGNGAWLGNVDGLIVDSEIRGGNGGTNISWFSSPSSVVNGGWGLSLRGTTKLTVQNSIIAGGNGGFMNNKDKGGIANGANGIVVDGVHDITLDFDADTTVFGGNGGVVTKTDGNLGTAAGGSALYINSFEEPEEGKPQEGGAKVKITGGTFQAGAGGTVSGKQRANGVAIKYTGTQGIINLEGGTFIGGLYFEGDSTLTMKGAVDDSQSSLQLSGTKLELKEWHENQLSDILLTEGTMIFDGPTSFVLDGSFVIEDETSASKAQFKSGLVMDGGILDLGVSPSTASEIEIKSGSTVKTTLKGEVIGSLSTKSLVVKPGAKWVITDIGKREFESGEEFELATVNLQAGGSIVTDMDAADVSYVGNNGALGFLGKIVEVNTNETGEALVAVYGRGDLADVLGVKGDTSSFGRVISEVQALVPADSPGEKGLGEISTSAAVAQNVLANGMIGTAQGTKASSGRQKQTTSVINNRTHSHHNNQGVGHPTSMTGPGGWNFLRSLSDRADSQLNMDGLRRFSDRIEGQGKSDSLSASMRNAESRFSIDSLRLPETWQLWGEGYGSTEKQDTRNGVAGYDVGTGGALLGVDKRFNNLILGVAGGFSQSTVSGYAHNNAKIDSIDAIVYMSTYNEKAYLDVNMSYSLNSVDTTFEQLGYTGAYDANTLGLYVGGGYGLALNDWLVLTPEASLMVARYSRESYDETSANFLPTKQYDSYDQVSTIGSIGATLSMIKSIDLSESQLLIQPELRFHLMHDFNATMDPETYTLQGGTQNIETPLVSSQENLIKVGAGLRMSKWDSKATEFGVDVDGLFADGYNAYMISGRIVHRF